jgi:UDP-N-acetylglucosamine--N-acetylmuramyl-(pentapeptide) pyrophosphoryl-undecaprenol N-acetylglucosamine transferase
MTSSKGRAHRVLIAGGGTGGHVFPAVAVRQAISVREPNAQVLFLGTRNGLEARVIPKLGERFGTIWVSGFSRSHPLQNILLPLKLLASIIQSIWFLLKFRPHIVIGTGGYVMGPVLWIAQRFGFPTLIQEQNSLPGWTTRRLSRRATTVCVGFAETAGRLKAANLVHTGNPLRSSFRTITRSEAREHWKLDEDRRTLLVVGGSLGARSINEAIGSVLPDLLAKYNLIWQTGKSGVPAKTNLDKLKTAEADHQLIVREFIDDMPGAYAMSDLALCRAGAMTLAELAVSGVPAILIPYPFAAEDHQTVNGQSIVDAGAAIMIQDRDLSGDAIIAAISRCLDSSEDHERMKNAMKAMARPAAAMDIADIALKIARRA